jgi:bacterioferritin-associated ferredoxin
MIVCSCNVLTSARVRAAALALAAEDPVRPITPGRLFRRLGARPNCGSCFTTIRQIIADAGLVFTCPEPLATVAESSAELNEAVLIILDVDPSAPGV